ncbi:MAG TPA: polysaccharide deacetylase family protein [Rhodospirillales bacterium]|nr:polysaccharide deacetylase family protein [Rhodospirillales bacterium]
MSDWGDLSDELDAWQRAECRAHFWWRDDDATGVTPALLRLLDLAHRHETPVALAVIPRDAKDDLRRHLADRPLAWVLQHGWSHDNHAPDGDRQEEFGVHRSLPAMLAELAEGWRRIGGFARAVPVMVAPWNRMDPHLLPHLPAVGLTAVSTLGPRQRPEAAPGVRRTNVHVDLIDWQGTRGFMGAGLVLEQVLAHLRARRAGTADADEPTGLMTHHGFHDEGCWAFIDELLARTRAHPAVRWLAAPEAFGR